MASGLMTACSQEEEAMEHAGAALPEGKYPLEIGRVTVGGESEARPWGVRQGTRQDVRQDAQGTRQAPQTRMSESEDGNSSTWEGDEEITVELDGKTTTFRIGSGGSATPTGEPLYWKDTQEATVTAWYPAGASVSLADQSAGLAYVLRGSGTGKFDTPVALDFAHQLAKVRVVFSDESTADLTDASVSILAPTSCTVDKGYVTAGGTTDYIPMHLSTYNGQVCYEANVTPNLILKENAFRLTVEGKTVTCSTTEVTTQAGQLHVVTLKVDEQFEEVNISDISGTEYTVKGNVYLKGDGQAQDLKLRMEAGAKLTIEDVILTPQTDGHAITCMGDATITLKGSNSLTGCANGNDGSNGIRVEGGTLTINGDDNAELKAKGANFRGAGIGGINGANITINGGRITADGSGGQAAGIGSAGYQYGCGAITINGGIIEARGGSFAAGIGCSNKGDCGDIIITGGNITAYGGQGQPGIGNGAHANCGNITISGANTVVYAKKGEHYIGIVAEQSIGYGYSGSCGTVTIGPKCQVTQE